MGRAGTAGRKLLAPGSERVVCLMLGSGVMGVVHEEGMIDLLGDSRDRWLVQALAGGMVVLAAAAEG